MELTFQAFDLLPRGGALRAVQFGDRGAGQSPLGAVQDR